MSAAGEPAPPSLRGHHLVCLHFYGGEGYDVSFVAHLRRLLDAAASRGVTVVDGADDLCLRCPHLRGGVCNSGPGAAGEIHAMDARALALLGLTPGDAAGWGLLRGRVEEIFPAWNRGECRRCAWREACLKDPGYRALAGE